MHIYRIKSDNLVKIGGIPVRLKSETAIESGTALESIDWIDIPDEDILKLVGGNWLTLKKVKEEDKK